MRTRRLSTAASTLACVAATAGFSPLPLRRRIGSRQAQPPPFRKKPADIGRQSPTPFGRAHPSSCQVVLQAGSAGADASPDGAAIDTGRSLTYYERLLYRFQGDFDNYAQVVEDRGRGMGAGEGGGHEHIHCTLVPCPQREDDQWVLAAFYFNGNPKQIFRFRLYRLIEPSSEDAPVRMKLNTLLPGLESRLRQFSGKPGVWWREVMNVWRNETNGVAGWNDMRSEGLSSMSAPLEGCDVLWEPDWDPLKHKYLFTDEYGDSSTGKDASTDAGVRNGESYHATMEAGSKGAIVDSISLVPGKRILIKDELSLWKDEFWINDRGYDPDAPEEDGALPFVYGNRRGVPYKLRRVSSFFDMGTHCTLVKVGGEPDLELERIITGADLAWTLGDEYRSPELLQSKMEVLAISSGD